jgi:toxin ParE1/3/4
VRIDYSREAVDDLEQIERYYAERASVEIAQEFILRVRTTLQALIARNPRIGRLRPEFGVETRSFPVLPFVIFYRIVGQRVYVRRILHGHRDVRPPLASLLVAV